MPDESFRLAVVGSRTWDNYTCINWNLKIQQFHYANMVIVTGTDWHSWSEPDYGADQMATYWSRHHGAHVIIYTADWSTHGKSAGFLRNSDIVADCDAVLAFWDGASRGTRDTLEKARKAGKLCTVITPTGESYTYGETT